MNHRRGEIIPAEFREAEGFEKQIREHHKPFFAFSAGDMLPAERRIENNRR